VADQVRQDRLNLADAQMRLADCLNSSAATRASGVGGSWTHAPRL